MTRTTSAMAAAVLVVALLAGCAAPVPGGSDADPTSPDPAAGADSGQAPGVEGVATLELDGETYTFADIPDDGFESACRVFGASLQAILPADDGSGATLYLYLLNRDDIDDPGNYDEPGIEFQSADGEAWVAGDYALAYTGVRAEDFPFEIGFDARSGAGTVTVGLIADANTGGISRSADATFSVECFTP